MESTDKEYFEYNGNFQARLILRGKWLYDNTSRMSVQIFAINYDYFYEMDKQDGFLKQGQKQELNQDGEIYVVVWHENNYFSFSGSVDFGGLTLEDAKKSAERVVKKIEWTNPVTKRFV